MKSRHVLLYKNGMADAQAMGDLGCYEKWFRHALGPEVDLEVHRGFEAPRRSILGYHGIILTGSPLSLAEPEPWMDEAAEFVRRVVRFGVPVLGVCFGHQLLGYAFGGKVHKNPRGWEAGTSTVWLTEAGRRDPLFHELADAEGRLPVNESHRDEVCALGPEATLLAKNERSPIQALGIGDHVRGVQFHPEMTGEVMRRLVHHRRAVLDDDARKHDRPRDSAAAILGRTGDTPAARRILDNWLRFFVWPA